MTAARLADEIRTSVFVAPGQPLKLRSFPRPALAAGAGAGADHLLHVVRKRSPYLPRQRKTSSV